MNAYCTAGLTANRLDNGSVVVDICETHYSHTLSIGHLRLSNVIRKEIAKKLSEGVTIDRILDDVRDSVSTDFKRSHILTRRDIHNIERAFSLRGLERHADDATSVALLVEELKHNDKESPILLYKQQGKYLKDYPFLDIEDFVLILQTPFQAHIMKEFGNNIICIDSTFKTTGYDFVLITVLVIDEFGEGYPTAWCLTTREDQEVVALFFEAIRHKIGMISPRFIMTDDAEQFFNAWKLVFGDSSHKLLCTWHVDRAWRGALGNKIGDENLRCKVYHSLCTIAEEPDADIFHKLLLNFEQQLQEHDETRHFAEYFHTYYSLRKEQWAICYRRRSGINTNMHIESFHRLLKYVYMKGKVNKRVDKCIHLLLKIARDKVFERLIKLEKGKVSHRITTVRQRHKTSLEMSTELVKDVSDGLWNITSSSNPFHTYEIRKEECNCSITCPIRCTDCDICVHQYSCTCPDSLVCLTMCKHIHLLLRKLSTRGSNQQLQSHMNLSSNQTTDYKTQNNALLLEEVANKSKISILQKNINTLSSLVQKNNDDQDMIKRVNPLVCKAIHIVQLAQTKSMEYKIKAPVNKNISPQKPFHSQRKRPRKATVRLAKPNVASKLLTRQLIFTNDNTLTKVTPEDDRYGKCAEVNYSYVYTIFSIGCCI